jgi:hypothetical protein
MVRCLFVLVMIIDHMSGPSILYLLTGGNRFLTSAAEGFILTSGVVTGLVYARLIRRRGLSAGLLKLLQRAWALYLLTAGLTVVLLPASEFLGLYWAQGVKLSHPIGLVVSILTLHRTYYLTNVLLLYTMLFIVAPLVFILLANGCVWPVLALSAAFWLLSQLFPSYIILPWATTGAYVFSFPAWQALFLPGLVLGYHHDRIPALGRTGARLALRLLAAITACLFAIWYLVDPPSWVAPTTATAANPAFGAMRSLLRSWVFDKNGLGPGRIIVSVLVFCLLFLFVSAYWRQVQRWLAWLLLPFGQHALYAYTAHILTLFAVTTGLQLLSVTSWSSQSVSLALQVGGVLFVWVLIRRQVFFASDRTRRFWYALPWGLAVVVLALLLALPWLGA